MTVQPLTPTNPVAILVGKTLNQIDDALAKYGIPTDAGNTEPVITVHKVYDTATLNSVIALPLDPTTPYGFVCDPDGLPTLVRRGIEAYFGLAQTVSSCLAMRNNETVLRRS